MLKFLPAIYPFIFVVISCVITELHARNYRFVRILSERLKFILGTDALPVSPQSSADPPM